MTREGEVRSTDADIFGKGELNVAEGRVVPSYRGVTLGRPPTAGLLGDATHGNRIAPEFLTAVVVWGSAALAPILTSVAGLLLARGLAASDYGEVAYFLSSVGLAVLIGSMGLTTQMTTVVAQHSALGTLNGAVPRVLTLAVVRLCTIAVLCSGAVVMGAAGNLVLRAAGLTAGVVLATGFVNGAIRGAGRARLAASLQVIQSAIYLVAVVTWARSSPERVFTAMAASYGLALLISLPYCRSLLAACLRVGVRARTPIRSIVSSSSQVYLLSLLLAPFASCAVLALGVRGRLDAAAVLSAALTLALAPSTALALVVSIQYYPRACMLAASGERGAAWFAWFYRPFATLGVAVVAVQVVFPGDAIVALFSTKYVGASDTLRSLAAAGMFLNLGQLAVWTLFAHGRVRGALVGTGAQLAILIGWVFLTTQLLGLPLWVLGAGHTVASGIGLTAYAFAMKRLDGEFCLHFRRLATALLLALTVEICLRNVLIATLSVEYLPFVALVLATLIGALVAAMVLMSESLAPLWRQSGRVRLGGVQR